jgi:hypothetical protein
MDWACSSNRETGKMNRTLVGKPFGMNRMEVSYEDLNWIEVVQDLVLALLFRFLSFLSRTSVCYFTYVLTSFQTTQNIYCIPVFAAFAKLGKVTLTSLCLSVRPSVLLSFSRPSVCLSLWNDSALTGRIFMKFYIWRFIENLLREFRFY